MKTVSPVSHKNAAYANRLSLPGWEHFAYCRGVGFLIECPLWKYNSLLEEDESSDMADEDKFYLIREDILPEGVLKAAQAKELLARGEAKTIHDAVEHVGLSRSAYYKYKDGIFPYSKLERERLATISMDLEHRAGILSRVLALIAGQEGNVLTIHQTIPLQGMANVVISVDTSGMSEGVAELLALLLKQDGVRRAAIIGQGG